MKVLRLIVTPLNHFKNHTLDIDFTASQPFDPNFPEERLTRINHYIYALNTVAFIGINASGKTTTLNIIKCCFDLFLNHESLNASSQFLTHFDDNVTCTIYIAHENAIFRAQVRINKTDKDCYITEEHISKRRLNAKVKRRNVFQPELYDCIHEIKYEDCAHHYSVLPELMNIHSLQRVFEYHHSVSNKELITFLSETSNQSFLECLDNSVEYYRVSFNKKPELIIKFNNREKALHLTEETLHLYISSGTRKILTLLYGIIKTLKSRGYLFVDALEISLDRRYILDLLNFFLTTSNKYGATLIFSTHYIEVLDLINR
ncbi:AAA family ATPase, partial [Staphylococcus argensis]